MAVSDSTGDSGKCSHSTDSRPSLLDRLKCSEPSVYARKQKVETNLPVGANWRIASDKVLSHTYTPRNLSRRHNEWRSSLTKVWWSLGVTSFVLHAERKSVWRPVSFVFMLNPRNIYLARNVWSKNISMTWILHKLLRNTMSNNT